MQHEDCRGLGASMIRYVTFYSYTVLLLSASDDFLTSCVLTESEMNLAIVSLKLPILDSFSLKEPKHLKNEKLYINY